MNAKKRITFIMNPISGDVNKLGIKNAIEECINKDIYDYNIALTEYAGHAKDIALKAKDEGVDIVVAVGGDGTVNEVGRALIQSNTSMGIIPCGSGNGLARHLMVPINIKKAINIINEGIIHSVDYGVINNKPFFCTCGMGFDAFISMKFAESGKRGPIPYFQNVLKEGLKYKPELYEITDNYGRTMKLKAYLISCANASQYGNNAWISPQSSMTDGLIDVMIIEPFRVIDAPEVGFDLMNKTLHKSSKTESFKVKSLNIIREREGAVHIDGDPMIMDKEINVSIKERGLKIVVPKDVDKTKRQPNIMQNAVADMFNSMTKMRENISNLINENNQKQ